MGIDFQNKIDEHEEIMENGDRLNFQMWLHDDEYKELISRTPEENIHKNFEHFLLETDMTFDVTANLRKDKSVEIILVIQDDENDWRDYTIIPSEKEKQSILAEMERVAKLQSTSVNELINRIENP